MTRSEHQQLVDEFMRKAGQEVPASIGVPTPEVRELRARLILEEAFETVEALGVSVYLTIGEAFKYATDYGDFEIVADESVDLEKVADGCADIKVVTTGTLSACGIDDVELQGEIDQANLRKFGPGSYKREDGKWIKPPDWVPPDISKVLWDNSRTDITYRLMSTQEVADTMFEMQGELKQRELDDGPNYDREMYKGKLCPHCKTPISDELVRQLVEGARSEAMCPGCLKSFRIETTDDSEFTLGTV